MTRSAAAEPPSAAAAAPPSAAAAAPPSAAAAVRGRPRDPACDRAIIEATIELIAQVGYERASLDAIAARAGVSKPTIYRRWPRGKEELVTSVVAHCRERFAKPTETGTLRGDLLALVWELIEGMREYAHLAAGLAQLLRENPALARIFRREIVADKRDRFRAILERALERGELARMPPAPELLADIAPAIVHSRALITGEKLDRGFVEALVDQVLLPALQARR